MPGVTTETVQQNYDSFVEMGKNGSFSQSGALILSHEINNMTMDMAMHNYPKLKDAYDHVIDVATCKNITNPYAENTITFPNFEQYIKDGGKNNGGSATPAGNGESAAAPMASINGALFASALFAVLAFA